MSRPMYHRDMTHAPAGPPVWQTSFGTPRFSAMRSLTVAFAVALVWLAGGCGAGGGSGRQDPAFADAFPAELTGGMLAPQELVIHPLSRVSVETRGTESDAAQTQDPHEVRLVLHLELLDEQRQSIKALGRFRITLDARDERSPMPAPGGASPSPTTEAVEVAALRPLAPAEPAARSSRSFAWALDLTDPRVNARYYDDLVTRTYTVTLAGLPEWVEEWARTGRVNATAPGQGPLVRASFEYVQTPRAGTPTELPPDDEAQASGRRGSKNVDEPSTEPTPQPARPRVRLLNAEARIGR